MNTAAQLAPDRDISLDIDLYEDRIRLLELLAAAYRLPDGFLDPMQGDLIQTRWQLSSGRAANPWWHRINYTLTVWRMQALQSRGEFSSVALHGAMQVPLPDHVRHDLFEYYDAVRAAATVDEAAETRLQRLFWTVHEDTVAAATRAAVDLVPTLQPGEYEFALGWGKVMVGILAGADFFTARQFVGPLNADLLPQRICQAADIDPLQPSDLPLPQRGTVTMIAKLFRNSDLSPLYTPVLESGPAALNEAIECRLQVDHDLRSLVRHLRRGISLP